MSAGLPPRLRPLWPYFKRVHRWLAFGMGFYHRALSPLLGDRGVPRHAYLSSAAAAEVESSRVVLTSAGGAYLMTRDVPEGDPSGRAVFESGSQVDVAERYVLEVEDGRLVGDFGALVTADRKLDYETSNYFGLSKWREHPLYLSPSLGSMRHVSGRVLSLTSPGTATNYYHFLYDAIGRLQVLEASGISRDFDAVIVPHGSGYQKQLLEWVGIEGPLIQLDRHQSVVADQLVVPSTPNSDVIAPLETVAWLRKTFLPPVAPPASERIFITRGEVRGSRRYVQEDRLWPLLEMRGFRRVDPGTLTVREQVDLFSRSELVVSPHGAGLTNITFAPAGVQVLELFAPRYVHLGLWGICEALGHVRYRYLVGDGPAGSRTRPRPFDDISLDPSRIINVVDEMISERDAADRTTHP